MEASVGMAKAVIGYGIGLAVLGIVVGYAVRGCLKVRNDKVLTLARRDRGRPGPPIDCRYQQTMLGTPVPPGRPQVSPRETRRLSGPYDQASERVDA